MHFFNNNSAVLIINPNAGTKRLAFLKRSLHNYPDVFDYTTIDNLADFRSFLRKKLMDYEIFVAVGGDGTVNSLAAEILGTGKILAVLPVGSGNGFAREMGFKKDLESLASCIKNGNTIDTDVLFINHMPCINMAGNGLDSFVAHEFHGLPRRGFWNYAITTLRISSGLKPFRISIQTAEGAKTEESVYMLSVANTRQFGNNAIIAPGAKPDDGLFNLAVVKPFPVLLFPYFAVKVMTGTLGESKYVKFIPSANAVISSEDSRFHIDGEPLLITGDINITVRRAALKVLRTDNYPWK